MELDDPRVPKTGLIYLGSPYTSLDAFVMEQRYTWVKWATAEIIHTGRTVFSPINHCHPLALSYDLPRDIDFWENYDANFIRAADWVWILQLDGWSGSRGIKRELEIAKAYEKPVYMVQVVMNPMGVYRLIVDERAA
jgi:hypothetical protein